MSMPPADAGRRLLRIAVVGDLAVLAALTVFGFAVHSELEALSRMLIALAAFGGAWLWVAPWFGVYRRPVLSRPSAVWRVAWAWTAAAPLGALARSVLLDREIVVVLFTLIAGAIDGLGLVVWRTGLAWWGRHRIGEPPTSARSS